MGAGKAQSIRKPAAGSETQLASIGKEEMELAGELDSPIFGALDSAGYGTAPILMSAIRRRENCRERMYR
jgi:hypothetical protein